MEEPVIKICKIGIEDERWQEYVHHHPHGGIFHHPAWMKLLVRAYGYKAFIYAAFKEGGGIVAGIPLMEIDSFITAKRWVSLPFSDHCAGLYDDINYLGLILERLAPEQKNNKLKIIEIRSSLPKQENIHYIYPAVLTTLILEDKPELVFHKISAVTQRCIKKAQHRDLTIKYGTRGQDVDIFYRLHLMTRKRQGIPVQPKRFFDLLKSDILDKGLGFISIAYKGEVPVAGFVLLKYKKTLTYKYGASDMRYLDLMANHLMFWNVMEWGCQNGFNLLDLGKTEIDNEGLRDFKRNLGGTEKELLYGLVQNGQNGSDAKGKKIAGRILKSVIQRSPRFICRLTGELLYRHFG